MTSKYSQRSAFWILHNSLWFDYFSHSYALPRKAPSFDFAFRYATKIKCKSSGHLAWAPTNLQYERGIFALLLTLICCLLFIEYTRSKWSYSVVWTCGCANAFGISNENLFHVADAAPQTIIHQQQLLILRICIKYMYMFWPLHLRG